MRENVVIRYKKDCPCPKVLYANTRSVLSKLEVIRVTIVERKIDCFVPIESWLTEFYNDELLNIDGFLSFRNDRLNRCGLVVVVLSFGLAIVFLLFLCQFAINRRIDTEIECVAVILRTSCMLHSFSACSYPK